MIKDLLDIGGIALGAVGNEDFIGADLAASGREIIFRDGFPQEAVAQIRGVAAEGLGPAHFIDGPVQSVDHGRRQRLGNISDAQADDRRFGMGVGISLCLFCHGRKQIAAGQFQVILICKKHLVLLFTKCSLDGLVRSRHAPALPFPFPFLSLKGFSLYFFCILMCI